MKKKNKKPKKNYLLAKFEALKRQKKQEAAKFLTRCSISQSDKAVCSSEEKRKHAIPKPAASNSYQHIRCMLQGNIIHGRPQIKYRAEQTYTWLQTLLILNFICLTGYCSPGVNNLYCLNSLTGLNEEYNAKDRTTNVVHEFL